MGSVSARGSYTVVWLPISAAASWAVFHKNVASLNLISSCVVWVNAAILSQRTWQTTRRDLCWRHWGLEKSGSQSHGRPASCARVKSTVSESALTDRKLPNSCACPCLIYVCISSLCFFLFCLGGAHAISPYMLPTLSQRDMWDIIAFLENLDILVSCLMEDCGLEKTSTPKFFQPHSF